MNTQSKYEKGLQIGYLVDDIMFKSTTVEDIAKRSGCSAILLKEVLMGDAENISHSTLDTMISNLRNYK